MKNPSVRTILACLPAALAVIMLLVFVTRFMRGGELHEVIRMDSGWTVTFADEVLEDVTLSDLPGRLGRRLQRGEEIRLEQRIPKDIHESPTLEMLINYFAAEVFLDGERIGAPAFERYLAGGFVGGSRYYINLPAEHAGKTLSLVFYAGENNLKPVLYPPRLGEFHDLIHVMIVHYGYALLIGIFMCLFGGFFLLFSLFVSVLLPEIRGQRVSSLLSILFGVWILTHYRILTVVTGGARNMTVEYITFYACLPLLYHLVSRIRETNLVFRTMQVITTGGVLLSYLLHGTGILYMHRLRYAYYVLSTAFLALLLTLFVTDLKQKRMRPLDIIQMTAPTLFCLSIFIAMVINLPSGEDIEVQTVSIVILTTGPLLFAMMRFLIYSWMMMEAAPQKFAFASLQQMAYTDSLTGLKNRTWMAERYAQLNRGKEDYCMISLDLNGLKYVNDTFGHTEGDRLLRSFSTMLGEALPEEADVMRIGGDEFLVISTGMDEHSVRGCLSALTGRFSALDQTSSRIPHSFAAGYAFRHEFPDADAHGIYLQADERMYRQKHALRA